MRVMQFATVAHRVGNRVRLSIPSRRGDTIYFAELEEAFLRSGEVLSARANPLAGSIVIRHAPAFTLSPTSLARFDLVCAMSSAVPRQSAPQESSADVLRHMGLQIVTAALGQQPALRLSVLVAEFCLQLLLHRLTRAQAASSLISTT